MTNAVQSLRNAGLSGSLPHQTADGETFLEDYVLAMAQILELFDKNEMGRTGIHKSAARAPGRARCPRLHAVLTSVSFLLCLVPASVLAKQTAGREISSHSLPDEPLPKSGPQSSAQQSRSAEGSASVAGTVLDVSGGAVPGAEVSLMHGDGTQLHTMVSEANGEFSFKKIPPGSYLVTVNAKGFAPFTSPEFDVTEQQTYEVPNVSLSVATANIEVTVRPTDLIATEQALKRYLISQFTPPPRIFLKLL